MKVTIFDGRLAVRRIMAMLLSVLALTLFAVPGESAKAGMNMAFNASEHVRKYVEMGGRKWIVADVVDGKPYLMMDSIYKSTQWHMLNNNSNAKSIFSYLNNEFDQIISVAEDRDWIAETEWQIRSMDPRVKNMDYDTAGGHEINPASITQKLGLPSYRDMELCNNFQPVLGGLVWTRTPVYYSDTQVIAIRSTGAGCGFDTPNANNSSVGVKPVLYLKDSVRIRGGSGTSADPYVLSVTNDPTGANAIVANGTTNQVTVSNVPADMTVNVYADDGTTLIGSSKNGSSPGTVIISVNPNVKDLRWKDKVYVAFKQPGKAESGRVEAIVIDTDPPSIVIEVPSEPSNTDVTVTVIMTDASDIVVRKWAMGIRDANYFQTGSGNDIAGNSFHVMENGNYTVYAKDAAGYDAVETIYIGLIDRTLPELSDVYISSNNSNPGLAKVGDKIALTFKASEALGVMPEVTISGQPAIIADMGGLVYQAEYTMQETDSEGVIKFTINYQDLAGNKGEVVTSASDGFEIQFDRTPPAKPAFSADITVPTQNHVTVTIACPEEEDVRHCEYRIDDGASWAAYVEPIEMNENGTIHARAVDEAGNVSDEATYLVGNIDKDKPIIEPPVFNPDKPTNQDVTVTVAVHDASSDIVDTRWAIGEQPIAYFEPGGTSFDGSFVVEQNGTYTVYALDEAGNAAVAIFSVSHIFKDRPDIKLTANPADPTNGSVSVTASVDAEAGIVEQKYDFGKHPLEFFATGGKTLGSDPIEMNDNGWVSVYARDAAGNEAVEYLEITNIDRIKPSIALVPSTIDPTNQDVVVAATASDGESGIKLLKWAYGEQGKPYFDTGGTVFAGSFAATENGTYTVYAEDVAGNQAVEQIEITNIDRIKPAIALTPSTADPTNQDVIVTATVSDGESGAKLLKWAYGEQSAPYFDTGGTVFAGSFAATVNGTYTVYAEDHAGNQAVEHILIQNIFKTGPTILLTPQVTVPTNQPVTVTMEVYAQTGVAEVKYEFGQHHEAHFASGGTSLSLADLRIMVTDNGWLTVYVKDHAGNETVEYIEMTNIDRDKPVIELIGPDRMRIQSGGVFTDPGATAWDDQDGDLSAAVVVSDDVNPNRSGTYQVEYRVADRAGNEADPVIRTVIVYRPSSNDPITADEPDEPDMTEETDEMDEPDESDETDETDVMDEIEPGEGEWQPLIFTDIGNHWAQQAIQQLSARGIISGYPDDTFRPDNPITRAEFLVMLMRLLGEEEVEAELPFADREQIGSWAERAIAQAIMLGIVQGYEDGSFRPNQHITRTEMSAMIARAIGLGEEPAEQTRFADDEDIPSWAKAAVEAMRKQGIIQGRGNGQFVPNASATRGEAAAIMLRIISIIDA